MEEEKCYCHKCGSRIQRNFQYCNKCGNENVLYDSSNSNFNDFVQDHREKTFKGRWNAFKYNLAIKYYNLRNKVDNTLVNTREGLVKQIDKTLTRMQTEEQSLPGFRALSAGGKSRVIDALQNTRIKLQKHEEDMEESDIKALEVYLETLPERLKKENCIVCMRSVTDSNETIVICPFCERGGHKSHMITWLENSKICPLCRSALTKNDLAEFRID